MRPAVAMDGGDIVFQGFDDGVVTLQMRGACQGCPSSTATLKWALKICYDTISQKYERFGPLKFEAGLKSSEATGK